MRAVVSNPVLGIVLVAVPSLLLVVQQGLGVVPADPARFTRIRRVLLITIVAVAGCLALVMLGRFYYLRT